MDFQKVHGWPRPVRIRLQGSEPGTVCQSFFEHKKRRIVQNDTAFYGPRGIRTLDLSDANRTLSHADLKEAPKGQNISFEKWQKT